MATRFVFKLKNCKYFSIYVMHVIHVMLTLYVRFGFCHSHHPVGIRLICCVILTSKYNPFFCVFKEWCSYERKDYRGVVKGLLKIKKQFKKDRRNIICQFHYIVKMVLDRPPMELIIYV